ncbi:MAG: nitroreductase family protein [Bacteroidetes bacterium]|nr:nitroreductase family protein [Bacteroidota bacterium]
MDFNQCIKERRSIRNFTSQKVEHEKLERIIELARFSPSWKNSQTVRYIFVEDEQLKDKIANECVSGFVNNSNTIKKAPLLVVIATIKSRCGYERDGSFTTSKGDGWEMFDAGIATQTFCLASHSENLGTVVMGIFDEEKLGEAISLPENQKVSAIIALGYPTEPVNTPKRKEVSELITYK